MRKRLLPILACAAGLIAVVLPALTTTDQVSRDVGMLADETVIDGPIGDPTSDVRAHLIGGG
jgi:hypothetical protein